MSATVYEVGLLVIEVLKMWCDSRVQYGGRGEGMGEGLWDILPGNVPPSLSLSLPPPPKKKKKRYLHTYSKFITLLVLSKLKYCAVENAVHDYIVYISCI